MIPGARSWCYAIPGCSPLIRYRCYTLLEERVLLQCDHLRCDDYSYMYCY